MSVHVEHCDDARLRSLLSEDVTSDESHAVAEHIETCASCQARMTTLAADESWWHDAQALLSNSEDHRWEPDTSWSSMLTLDSIHDREPDDSLRSLLGSPSHPEMLGRLGRYDIERVIGTGGMGVVFKAHDSELNRPVAIKLLASHLAHSGAARERFAREGRAAAAVVHEHVVAIYNVESDGKAPFLVMQFVPGRSLQTRVDEDGPLGTEQILRIGMQAAAGLAAAHRQGLVHRDVKPSNILLEDTVERAILTDFGLARAIDDASLTQTGVLAGTPHYMSPEQATGGVIDHRSDLFSLGAVLYYMATGHPPFRAAGAMAVLHRICREPHRPVWQRNKEIPDELSDIIDRLLEKKPAKRFASAEEVQEQLASLLSRVQQYGIRRRRFPGLRRHRRGLFAAAATLLFVVFAGWWLAGVERQRAPSGLEATTGQPPVATLDLGEAVAMLGKFNANERQFVEELQNVSGTVNSMGESFYLQQGDGNWSREVESLDHDLRQLESQTSLFSQ